MKIYFYNSISYKLHKIIVQINQAKKCLIVYLDTT